MSSHASQSLAYFGWLLSFGAQLCLSPGALGLSGGMWVPHAARHGWMNGGLRADLLRAIGAVGGMCMCIWFHSDAVSALRCVHAPAWGHVANAAIRETRQPVAGPSSAVSPACACGWGLRADYSLSGVCVSQADCTRRGFFRLCDDCGCLSIVFFRRVRVSAACLSIGCGCYFSCRCVGVFRWRVR